jgi:hypothetical protein
MSENDNRYEDWNLKHKIELSPDVKSKILNAPVDAPNSDARTWELEHTKSQVRSYEACTKKIMDIVDEAYPNERRSDYDVLPGGVRKLLNDKLKAESESAALRPITPIPKKPKG